MKAIDIIYTAFCMIILSCQISYWGVANSTKTPEIIQCDSLSAWKSERLVIYMDIVDLQSEIILKNSATKRMMENDTNLLNTIQKLY